MACSSCVELSRLVQYGTSPDEEKIRLDVLKRTGILDSSPEDISFDRLTRLAAKHFKAPVCLVSILDVSRLWMKSRFGLNAKEIPRDFAFCNYTLRADAPPVFIVLNADEDPRFCDKAFVVGPPYAKFYAGAPVMFEGIKLGSFCVLDGKPHADFDENDQSVLAQFASIASDLVAQHHQSTSFSKYDSYHLSTAILQVLREPVSICQQWNQQLESTFRVAQQSDSQSATWDEFHVTYDNFCTQVNSLQRSLEVALRFGRIVAYQSAEKMFKRRSEVRYTVKDFTESLRCLSAVDGFKASTFQTETLQSQVSGGVTESMQAFISEEPNVLAAVLGFLSLKHLWRHSHQRLSLSFKIEDPAETFSQSNSTAEYHAWGDVMSRGHLRVELAFEQVVHSEQHPADAASSAHSDSYDLNLIQDVMFGIHGHLLRQVAEDGSVIYELNLPLRCVWALTRPHAGSTSTTAVTVSADASPTWPMDEEVLTPTVSAPSPVHAKQLSGRAVVVPTDHDPLDEDPDLAKPVHAAKKSKPGSHSASDAPGARSASTAVYAGV